MVALVAWLGPVGSAGATPAPVVPPDLQALVTQANALPRDASETMRSQLWYDPGVLTEKVAKRKTVLTVTLTIGSAGAYTIDVQIPGGKHGTRLQLRSVGGEYFFGVTGLAAHDGGKSWVSLSPAQVARLIGASEIKLLASVSTATTPSRSLPTLVGLMASSVPKSEFGIYEVGPATVGAQAVTEFAGPVTASALPATISGVAIVPTLLTALHGFPVSIVSALRDLPFRMELFVAPDGELLRENLEATPLLAFFGATTDATPSATPVNIQPPPATQTVDYSKLTLRARNWLRTGVANNLTASLNASFGGIFGA